MNGAFSERSFTFPDIVAFTVYNGLVYYTTRTNKIGILNVQYGERVSIRTIPEEISITIDGVQYRGGNIYEWEKGSAHTFYVPESVSLSGRERLVFQEWNDGSKALSRSITVEGATSYIATYAKQYYLTVISDNGSPAGEGWYNDGTVVTVSLSSAEAPADFPYTNVFIGWGDDAQGNSLSTTILVNGPKTAVAQWEKRFSSSFFFLLGGVTFSAVLVTVFLLIRKKINPQAPSPAMETTIPPPPS